MFGVQRSLTRSLQSTWCGVFFACQLLYMPARVAGLSFFHSALSFWWYFFSTTSRHFFSDAFSSTNQH